MMRRVKCAHEAAETKGAILRIGDSLEIASTSRVA